MSEVVTLGELDCASLAVRRKSAQSPQDVRTEPTASNVVNYSKRRSGRG